MTFRQSLLASTIAAGGLFTASPVLSQTTAPATTGTQTAAAEATTEADSTIVVTGTLIRNPNLSRSAPVTVTNAEEIELKQSNVAEEVIREIPGVVPSIGSAVNNGNGGASFVDLRGLGSNRNIVLLDGNRIAPSGLVGRVDLNNIPLALVERVDVLTGGASTTYGADAISGVVNFITKQNFSGVDIAASQQITEKGDGNTFRTDATIGGNFDDGRGNAVFSIGYQQADPVFQGDRAFSFYNIDGNTANPAAAGSGTAVPARFTRPGSPSQQIDPSTGTLVPTYAPFNFNPYNIFQTPFQRFNIFGTAHYNVSDNLQIYTRGLYSKNTVKTILAPGGSFGEPVTINVSNPFLPAAARAQFCAANGITVAQCNAAALATDPADPNYRTFVTAVSRRTTELGPRLTSFTTQIFDYRLGAKYDLTSSISMDISGGYGESQTDQTVTGNLRSSRLRQAALASDVNTCINATDAGCVPVNLFGADGSITPAMGAFLAAKTSVTVKTSLAQVRGVLSGDFGVTSPWASDAISFAAGAEYRKYKASQDADILSQTPGEVSGTGGIASVFQGGYDVKEAFGELVVPLVSDQPFFQSLSVEGGIRYSDYSVDAPSSPKYKTTTYKGGVIWQPVDGIKLRGNYSHAVRAPNISELFTPSATSLTTITSDPCASVNQAGVRTNAAPTGNLQAVCLAQGATAANVSIIAPPTANQGNSVQGGNVNLKPETSNSYTLGVVLTPAQIVPSLSLTVDYYNIKVTGAVSTPTVGDALTACFGGVDPATANVTAASATNPACLSIRRNPLTGALDGSLATTPGIFLGLSNLGKLATDGIDVGANYNHDLGFAKLGLNFSGNYTFNSKFMASPSSINRDCTGYFSGNCASIQPKFQWSQRTTLSFDPVDISLLWRHIDKIKHEPLAGPLFSGAVPTQVGGSDNIFNGQTVNFNKIKAFDYFDLTGRVGVNDNLSLTVTVQNLLDKKPPITGASVGTPAFNSGNTYPSTYDALGRRYAVTARLRF